jgi:hypothetical protein
MADDVWDGDGITEDEEDLEFALEDLGLLPFEVLALEESCKREGWVHEKLAKHENHDRNIAISRYFWRRAQRFKEIAKAMDKDLTNGEV